MGPSDVVSGRAAPLNACRPMDTPRESPYTQTPRTYVHRLALLLALLLPACLNPNVDNAFCDADEECFAEPPGTGVFCGGVECEVNLCVTGWHCEVEQGVEQCAADGLTADFDDHNKCTIEECDPETGWNHRIPTAEEMDDGDPCTLDECDPAQGITHTDVCD